MPSEEEWKLIMEEDEEGAECGVLEESEIPRELYDMQQQDDQLQQLQKQM